MGNGFSWDFGRVKVFLWRWEGVVWDRVTGRIIEREGSEVRGWWNVESESVRAGFCES